MTSQEVHVFRITAEHLHRLFVYSYHYIDKTHKRRYRLCKVCHEPFKLGDLVVSCRKAHGGNTGYRRDYYHAKCWKGSEIKPKSLPLRNHRLKK